uniref:Uncharacterized protein n=1 Tax=Trichuris muris TaxID=70415 RepID=A0A5S6R370_TRIMR
MDQPTNRSCFLYPCSLSDVALSNADSEFSNGIIEASSLADRFSAFKADFDQNGSDAIGVHFNVFYSAIRQFECSDFGLIVSMWKALRKEMEFSAQTLQNLISEHADRDMLMDIRSKQYRLLFLLTTFAGLFEDDKLRKENTEADNDRKEARGGRKHARKAAVNERLPFRWTDEKKRLLTYYSTVLSPQFASVFEPDSSRENMVKAICSLCIRFFNSWDSSLQVPLFDLVVLLLEGGFDYAPALAMECAHCLSQPTADPTVFVDLVASVVQVDAGRRFVMLLLIEISKVDSTELANEGAGVKNYGSFLTQLTALFPDVVVRGLSALRTLRAKQSPTLRNGILSVYCELLSSKLCGEELEPRDRNLRDLCLNDMLEHLHDRSAHVRSKVLQLWKRLCLCKCIPLCTFSRLVPLAAGRLRDKSVLVRKSALQLLTTMVENNPFLVQLSIETIRKKIAEVVSDLEGLALLEQPLDDDDLVHCEEAKLWLQAKSTAEAAIESVHGTLWKGGTFVPTEQLSLATASAADLNDEICRVFELISSDEFEESIMAIVAIATKCPNNCYFSLVLKPSLSLEEFKAQLLPLLKKFYIGLRITGSVVYPDSLEEQNNKSSRFPPVFESMRKQMILRFLEDCLTFATRLSSTLPIVESMLSDSQQLDVVDSIQFLVVCAEHGILQPMDQCWCCWNLIWTGQKSVTTAVLCAFRRLYFCNRENARRDEEVVKRLIELTLRADHAKCITLEKLLHELFAENIVDKPFIRCCWNAFYSQISDEERAALITLLGMMLEADPHVFIEHIGDLITYTLGDTGHWDPCLALRGCEALKKLGDVDRVRVSERINLCQKHFTKYQLVPRIARILIDEISDDSHSVWVPLMRQAVELIFNVTRRPDVLIVKLLRSACKAALTATESKQITCMIRLIHFIGEVACRTVNFAEITMVGLVHNVQQQHTNKGQTDSRASEPTTSKGRIDALMESTPAEYARMSIEHLLETETLNASSVLRPFANFVISACENMKGNSYGCFGTALLKLMLISSKFCSIYCPLLFNILERLTYANLRTNIVQLLPDLYFRFPNELDPWTEKLFAILFDEDTGVRIVCISAISHLILQDRIKPRIFIADIAICCMDDNEDVANMAKGFFKEYSEKEPIYNSMAFIVQRLSEDRSTVDLEKFKSLMTWLFGLVRKDSQLEKVVERFCQLFSGVQSLKYLQNLSCSLTLLKYNDKMVRKLVENVRSYQSKLGEDIVYNNFVSIATVATKGASEETKLALKTWNDELCKWHALYSSAASQENELAKVERKDTTIVNGAPSPPVILDAMSASCEARSPSKEPPSAGEPIAEESHASRRVTRSMLEVSTAEPGEPIAEESHASRRVTRSMLEVSTAEPGEPIAEESHASRRVTRSMLEVSTAEPVQATASLSHNSLSQKSRKPQGNKIYVRSFHSGTWSEKKEALRTVEADGEAGLGSGGTFTTVTSSVTGCVSSITDLW